jgi:hypothetical protein
MSKGAETAHYKNQFVGKTKAEAALYGTLRMGTALSMSWESA